MDLWTELLFVTLDKSEGGFSPTTSYRDYAISREQFHWETQNSAAEDTPTGRRYIEQSGTASASSCSSARPAGMLSSPLARCAT